MLRKCSKNAMKLTKFFLSDPQKKQLVDQGLDPNDPSAGMNFGGGGDIDPSNIINLIFGGGMGGMGGGRAGRSGRQSNFNDGNIEFDMGSMFGGGMGGGGFSSGGQSGKKGSSRVYFTKG